MDDDILTPRDRISDDMLQKMLNGTDVRQSERPTPTREPSWESHEESCIMDSRWGLRNHPLASVYAPLQEFRNIYDRDTALHHGTIFTELNLPFLGESVYKGGCHV